MSQRDYHLIVIGGGGAGLAAAVTARDAGASVLICEAADRLGGSSAASGGLFYAAGTSLQRAQGIDDSADDLFHHYMLLNRWEIEPAVARRYADESAGTVEWLMSLGVEFHSEVLTVGQSKVPRGHLPKLNGFGIVQALDASVSRGGVEVALNARVERLLTDAAGSVVGVRVDGVDVRSDAVVVACGGVGNATRDVRRNYFPDSEMFGDEWNFYIGAETNRGDAIALAEGVGAEITGRNCGLMIASASYYKNVEGPLPGWPVFVNRRGRRFINEQADYSVVAHNINRQPDRICFAIMDHRAFTRSPDDARYRSVQIGGVGAPSFDPDWLAQGLAQGAIFSADSLEELAQKAQIRQEAFLSSIAEYNRDARDGCDSRFFKDAGAMVAIEQPPFYAVPRRAAQISVSSVGLHIDADARVYADAGSYVRGLYAAGEASGGVWNHYVASGCAIGNCMIFGRVAGRKAAAWSAELSGSSRAYRSEG